MDVEIVNLTGALAAVNVAGPQARDADGALTDLDVSADGFQYLDAKEAHVAGVPCLALRIGFVGELGYELHFPSPYGEHLWDTLARGAARRAVRARAAADPAPREGARHRRPGHRLRVERCSRPVMPWIVKLDKDDFVGKWALEHVQERGSRERLVGFEMQTARPPEGGRSSRRRGRSAA